MNISASFAIVLWFCHLSEIVYGAATKTTKKVQGDFRCGTFIPRGARIVGGADCFEGEFPWMVSLKSITGHFCGGFVVSERYVIAAAHCFLQKNAKHSSLRFDDNGKVVVSSFNATIGEFTLKSPETIPDVNVPISKLTLHPEYDADTRSNDIAIIELSENISIHPRVEPVCLPTAKHFLLPSKEATIAGWGKHDYTQSTDAWWIESDKLQKAEVSIQEIQKCRRNYSKLDIPLPSKGIICAGKFGKDSCQGDSGGPLMRLKDKKWTAIGVISFGKQCGDLNLPSVYTDISHYTGWIHEQMR